MDSIFATVGIVERPSDFEVEAGGSAREQNIDGGPASDGNTAPGDDEPDGAEPGEPDGEVSRPPDAALSDNCVELVDQSVQQYRAPDTGEIRMNTIEGEGCVPSDRSEKNAGLFWRRDGAALLEGGAVYSFRWPGTAVGVTNLRLRGGGSKCADTKVYEAQSTPTFLGSPGCRSFTPGVDVHYLRLLHDYTNNDYQTRRLAFQLCKAPCP